MNQGKKSFAHRSAPLKTQNRRVLPAACSTICGAIGRGAAGRWAACCRSGLACRRGPPGRRQRGRAFIVAAFPQQEWWD
ncbi:hypothetical protein DF133_32330 [Burkholderia cenocepacia]|nr:hypothetical protein DF133_32330 [Burkholderia cenocepacia]